MKEEEGCVGVVVSDRTRLLSWNVMDVGGRVGNLIYVDTIDNTIDTLVMKKVMRGHGRQCYSWNTNGEFGDYSERL